MKKQKDNKFHETSIHSMIRMSGISEYGFNDILPVILFREIENKKKIKKKKQNNIKQTNAKQIYKKLKREK